MSYIFSHLPSPQTLPPHIHTRLLNLYIIHSHSHLTPISPLNLRLSIATLPVTSGAPLHIVDFALRLQQTFKCVFQICTSVLDVSPISYRWCIWNSSSPTELGGFDIFSSPFSGSLICSFPIDPSEHRSLLARFSILLEQTAPFRVIFFTHTRSHLPSDFTDHQLPSYSSLFPLSS